MGDINMLEVISPCLGLASSAYALTSICRKSSPHMNPMKFHIFVYVLLDLLFNTCGIIMVFVNVTSFREACFIALPVVCLYCTVSVGRASRRSQVYKFLLLGLFDTLVPPGVMFAGVTDVRYWRKPMLRCREVTVFLGMGVRFVYMNFW